PRVEAPKPVEPAPAARPPEKPAPAAEKPAATRKPVEPAPVDLPPAEPTLYGIGAAEPTGAFDEPSGPFEAPPDEAEDEPEGLMILDENSFSGPGENTLNWAAPKKAAVTIEDLLGSAQPESDATLLSPLGVRGGDDLADWAANALGAPAEPRPATKPAAPAAPAARAEESAPRLREPRVAGSTGAAVDLRAGAKGVPPRIAGPEAIEVAEPTGEFPAVPDGDGELEDEPVGFHVHFERGAPARPAPRAPRLTEDDTGETTQPGAPAPEPGRGVQIDDRQVSALLEEALTQARRGDLQKAIQAFTDALDMRPTLTEAHIGRGRCHLELGDYSSAMSDFARAEDLAPDRPDAHVATGDLYFARKEYKRAIEFYDQAVELDGSHAMARCRRGISHYYRKNYRQAFQDLQRALALDPEIPNIRKYVQMAQKKLERGD
ncbi:MAG: tetratricopeptide repeat protein, partial [Myxococcota bacterium]